MLVIAGDAGAGAMRGSCVNVADPSVGQVAVLAQTSRCVGPGHLLSIAAPVTNYMELASIPQISQITRCFAGTN